MAGLSEMVMLAQAIQERQASGNRGRSGWDAVGETLSAGSSQFMPGMELGRKNRKEQEEMKLKQAEQMMNIAKFIQEQEKSKAEQAAAQQVAARNKAIMDDFNKENFTGAKSSEQIGGNKNADKLNSLYFSPAGKGYHKEYEFTGKESIMKIVPDKERTAKTESTAQARLFSKDVSSEAESIAKQVVVEKVDKLIANGQVDPILRGTYLQNNAPSQEMVDRFRPAAFARVNGDEEESKRLILQQRIDLLMSPNPNAPEQEPVAQKPEIKGSGIFDRFKKKESPMINKQSVYKVGDTVEKNGKTWKKREDGKWQAQ